MTMKKSYLFSALAAGMVMLSACSNDSDLTNGGSVETTEVAQQIVLQVANSGDGMQTRAGRPLYSSEAKQSIENVKVIICEEGTNTVKYVESIANWNTDEVSSTYNTHGHGREKVINLNKALEKGKTYLVYAFGYHNGTEYTNLSTAIAGVAKEATFNPNTVLELKDGVKGEEIFAGSAKITVHDGVGFRQSVVLNRQVAGTFGYFEAIPYIEGATKLQLVASTRNQNLILGQFHNTDLTQNGTSDSPYFVVNGTKSTTDKVIYEIDLTKWFTKIEDKDKDGLIDTDTWKNPYNPNNTDPNRPKFKTGSVFGGTFLVPFAKVATTNTFVLNLVKTDDEKVVQTWTIKLPAEDKQVAEHNLFSWTGTSFPTTAVKNTDNNIVYNVVRNHLYGIGTKTKDGEVVTPDKPGPDTPEPLKKKQELTLRVNDNWDIIHSLEIEEN